jgi:hypothetical protein
MFFMALIVCRLAWDGPLLGKLHYAPVVGAMSCDAARQPGRGARRRRVFVVVVSVALASGVGVIAACNDAPPAPSGPGNVLVDDSMQDAVAQLTQESGAPDVMYAPQGIGDAGDGGYGLDGTASTGYADVQSPQTACSSCKCDRRVGYCLENGTTVTFGAPPIDGFCALAKTPTPAVGCNALPAACAANPTCACILDAVQPPLGCYPECTTGGGFFDVFCPKP